MNPRWIVLLSTLLIMPAVGQEAPIYRWTTANGVTHYSMSPPDGVSAERLDQNRSRLNVVPAPPARTPEAHNITDTNQRIDQLQQELDEMRRQRREDEARAIAQEQARVTARKNCEERFREPCDDNGEPLRNNRVILPPQWDHSWNRPPTWQPPPPQPPPPPRRTFTPRV